MKNLRACLCLLLLGAPLLAFSPAHFPVSRSDSWVTTTVDKCLLVQSPVPLIVFDPTSAKGQQASTKDELASLRKTTFFVGRDPTGLYIVVRTDLTEDHLVPDGQRLTGSKLVSFFDGIVQGTIGSTQGVLISKTPFTVENYDGLDFVVKGLQKGTGKHVVRHLRAVLVGATSYVLNFVPADAADSTGTSGSAERTRFFHSMVLTPAASH